jgi:hypothetical protein
MRTPGIVRQVQRAQRGSDPAGVIDDDDFKAPIGEIVTQAAMDRRDMRRQGLGPL